ncbi:hypothetical protein B0T22DRAFT_440789 [Podospora appendiculata]|uniref:Uncharacterized protein n=1 Tax=Podospora appendiculata TaxID=314037 RepID=A0AAE0XAX3_9PEZI|nr:hypothetical protein B0T22DRAFT_440789 [Podospora appendiculata]
MKLREIQGRGFPLMKNASPCGTCFVINENREQLVFVHHEWDLNSNGEFTITPSIVARYPSLARAPAMEFMKHLLPDGPLRQHLEAFRDYARMQAANQLGLLLQPWEAEYIQQQIRKLSADWQQRMVEECKVYATMMYREIQNLEDGKYFKIPKDPNPKTAPGLSRCTIQHTQGDVGSEAGRDIRASRSPSWNNYLVSSPSPMGSPSQVLPTQSSAHSPSPGAGGSRRGNIVDLTRSPSQGRRGNMVDLTGSPSQGRPGNMVI